MKHQKNQEVFVLGVKIDDIPLTKALEKAREFFSHETCSMPARNASRSEAGGKQETRCSQGYVTTPNPEICLCAEKDEQYCQILNNSYLSLPDGFGLKIGARILGYKLHNRVTGVDFTLELIKLATEENWRVFLFGGEDGVAMKCQRVLGQRHKRLRIVGTCPGIIQNSRPPCFARPLRIAKRVGRARRIGQAKFKIDVISKINQTKPDILLVALGAPLQERWIAENLAHLSTVKLAIGVGGTFNFISGHIKRAPRLIRQLGLEWLWRLILEPWRWQRIYNAVLKFIVVVLKWRLRMLFCYRKNAVGFIIRGDSSVGRTSASQAENRGFESRSPLQFSSSQILLVEREDEPGHWQLPQGGIDPGELPQASIIREMKEEIGTDKFKTLKHIPQFYKYKWPKLDRIRRGYRGQIQDLFILQFIGQDSDINLDQKEHINFKWADINDAPNFVHQCRKEQMEKAIKIFSGISAVGSAQGWGS